MVLFNCVLALLACKTVERPGTLVGNPGKMTVRIAPLGEGVEPTSADTVAATVLWLGCGNGFTEAARAETLDLLRGEPLTIPGGRGCAVVLDFPEPLMVLSQGDREDRLVAELELPAPLTLFAGAPIAVDGEDYVLELGAPGWLFDVELGEGETEIEAGSELSRLLAIELIADSSLYPDTDGSGGLEEAERDAEPLAATFFPVPPELVGEGDTQEPISSESLQCETAPASGPVLLMLALLGLARRRHRQPKNNQHGRHPRRWLV